MLDVTNPEKRAKSDPGWDLETGDPNRDPTPIHPRDSSAPCEPQLGMSPTLWLECFQPLGKGEEMPGVVERQEGTTHPGAANPVPPAESQGSAKKTKSKASSKLGTSGNGLTPLKRDLPRRRNDGARILQTVDPLA